MRGAGASGILVRRMVQTSELAGRFRARFGSGGRVFSAPGRVNLIGEHTDYNDGFVMPFAIDRRTYVAAARRADRRLVVYSETLDAEFACDLGEARGGARGSFGDYIEGVARVLMARGVDVPGADLLIASEVPSGAGLSASAALELAVGLALCELTGAPVPDRLELALVGQRAEHEYVGTLCGIMDQLVSAMGRAGHALFIDCRSLESTLVPLRLDGAALLICDTRVKHSLASSAYNERRRECEAGVAALSRVLQGVRALRDVSLEDLLAQRALLNDVVFRRCRHVVSENARTEQARDALTHGDLRRVGELMIASHQSLRDDYAVSCPELDLAVDSALLVPGVFGSRMTGGGFGGCTVTLCEASRVEAVVAAIRSAFRSRELATPELFVTQSCDGVRVEL